MVSQSFKDSVYQLEKEMDQRKLSFDNFAGTLSPIDDDSKLSASTQKLKMELDQTHELENWEDRVAGGHEASPSKDTSNPVVNTAEAVGQRLESEESGEESDSPSPQAGLKSPDSIAGRLKSKPRSNPSKNEKDTIKLNWALPGRGKRRAKTDLQIFHKNIPAFGSPITMKEKGILRFALQNINGLLEARYLIGEAELAEMEAFGIGVLGLIETNINWDHVARESFIAAAKMKFGAARCSMSSSYSTKQGYLPCGVATVARGKICGRIQQRGADKWGRFTWTAFRGKQGKYLSMATEYAKRQVRMQGKIQPTCASG
jgi:hypothetical protein